MPLLLVAALFVLGFAQELAYGRAGCGSLDPTDAVNYSDVVIVNDGAAPVVVDECVGAYCRGYDLPATLPPGGRYADHAACAVSGVDMTSWRVSATTGGVLGYIAVDSPRSERHLMYNVSHASSDRRTPTPQG